MKEEDNIKDTIVALLVLFFSGPIGWAAVFYAHKIVTDREKFPTGQDLYDELSRTMGSESPSLDQCVLWKFEVRDTCYKWSKDGATEDTKPSWLKE